MNPELKRNFWLEFTKHRLISMPVTLFLIFFLIIKITNNNPKALESTSSFVFFILAFIWGIKLSSGAIIEEINNNSWDWQRLSNLSPLQLTIGKLFGPTSYIWYGGAICLTVYFSANSGLEINLFTILFNISCLILTALFGQALALFLSLELIRMRSPKQKKFFPFLLYLLALIISASYLPTLLNEEEGVISWFSNDFNAKSFTFCSVFIFLSWSIIGINRLIRLELSLKNTPWIFAAFSLFIMLYATGFNTALKFNTYDSLTLTSYFIGFLLTYYALFSENNNIIRYRKLFLNLKNRQYKNVFEDLPRWVTSITIFFIVSIFMILLNPINIGALEKYLNYPALIITAFLFLTRDIMINHYVIFNSKIKRKIQTTILYLFLLYLIIPTLVSVLGFGSFSSFFIPRPDLSLGLMILPVLGENILMALLIKKKLSNSLSISPSS